MVRRRNPIDPSQLEEQLKRVIGLLGLVYLTNLGFDLWAKTAGKSLPSISTITDASIVISVVAILIGVATATRQDYPQVIRRGSTIISIMGLFSVLVLNVSIPFGEGIISSGVVSVILLAILRAIIIHQAEAARRRSNLRSFRAERTDAS